VKDGTKEFLVGFHKIRKNEKSEEVILKDVN
jgi:hypothetical protein